MMLIIHVLMAIVFLEDISEASLRTPAIPRIASAPTTTSSPRKAALSTNIDLPGLIDLPVPLPLPRSQRIPILKLPQFTMAKSRSTATPRRIITSKRSNPTTRTVSMVPEQLQSFVERIEKQCDFTGLDAAYTDLQNLWTEVRRGGNEQALSETVDVQKFLNTLAEHYTECIYKEDHEHFDVEWERYMKIFGKNYDAWEKEMRKEIFKKKRMDVEKHNELYRNGKITYSTSKELEKLNCFRDSNATLDGNPRRKARFKEGTISKYYYHSQSIVVPASFDWRTKNSVTPVKHQGSCGSCYAITGNGALEAYHKKRTGDLVILSTQNILDCTWHLGNRGCVGGDHVTIFKYAESTGVVSNSRYPYTMNASHNCRWRREDVVVTNKGYYIVDHGNELALMQAVATHGPVAVAIGANGLDEYQSGVFYSEDCGPPDHTVLVVGYGTDSEHGDYWIARNCWGYWWGEDGYVRMARNRNNMCHIATHAYFPY